MDKEKCEITGNSCKCCNSNHHEDEKKENKTLEIALYIISIVVFILGFLPVFSSYKIWIYLAVVLMAGYELLLDGIKNIFHLNFEEDTLMTIAIISAFILGEYPESAMVVLLFKLGEFLEEKAVENSNKNIKDIVEIKAKTANLIKNEKQEVVDVETLKVGDKILIKPGEMVPLDCKIIKGTSSLNTANITGESAEVFVKEGESILSGSINLNGSLTCIVEKDIKNSTASQIVDLVYEATNNKGKTEKFITKFSKIYTPVVIIMAIVIATIVPFVLNVEFKEWILRALVFLVAACPCSIVISVPLAFFSCIGAISKKGMVIKGTKHIENFAKATQIAFDKTGTITTGKMQIDKIVTLGNIAENELLMYVNALEKNSNHPISTAIAKEVENKNIKDEKEVEDYEEIAGYGIKGKIDKKIVLFGNEKLLEKEDIAIKENLEKANYLVIDGKVEGYITLKEEIRKECKNIVKEFKKAKLNNIIILTGDNEKNAEKIAKEIDISKFYASLLPQEKLEKVKELKKEGKVIFVGDGINDSPVLAEASFGISMRDAAEIANNTADGILISNNISKIPDMIKVARKTMNIIKFNIAFSLIIKAVVLTLGVLGHAPIWLAIIADTGVSMLTVLNSVRILK